MFNRKWGIPALMLAVLIAGIVLGMGQSLGAVVLYLLVPFFLLGSIYITIALHVDVQHVLKICLAVGMGAALLFWLLFQYHYGFYEHSFRRAGQQSVRRL